MRLLSGGLNLLIEHHLFPSVNSCHLPVLSNIIKKVCKNHNIKYNESDSLYKSEKSVLKTVKKLNYNTIKDFDFNFA